MCIIVPQLNINKAHFNLEYKVNSEKEDLTGRFQERININCDNSHREIIEEKVK